MDDRPLILYSSRIRALCAMAFAAGLVAGALLLPRFSSGNAVVVPKPIPGEVLKIAGYLCDPNGGTVSMTPHADPERFSFKCRNDALFNQMRITLQTEEPR